MLKIEDLLDEVDRLPATEKWQLIRHVLDTLEQEVEPTRPVDYRQFLYETFGVLKDTPIARWNQGEYDNIVVKHNIGEFGRIASVQIEDWEEDLHA